MPDDQIAGIRLTLDALANGDQAGAINAVQSVISQFGETAETLHLLGLLALQMGDLSRALELFKGAHELDPERREYADALAIVHARSGRLNDCVYYGKLAVALKPHPDISNLLPEWAGSFEQNFMNVRESTYFAEGMQAYQAGLLDKALESFEKEAELHPSEGRSWRMLAQIMLQLGRPVEACLLLQGLENCDDFAREDYFLIGRAHALMGKFDQAIDAHVKAAGQDLRNADGLIERIAVLQAKPAFSMAEIRNAEERLAAAFNQELAAFPPKSVRLKSNEKLKVGLVSGRFRAGVGLDAFWPVILNSQASRLSFYCYSHNEFDDAMTRRVAGAAQEYIDLRDVNDRTAATIIHNDNVDVLIDLDGYRPTGRPRIFAQHPAPFQLRYQGLPELAEIQGFDACIGSKILYPADAENTLTVEGGLLGVPTDLDPGDGRPATGLWRIGWKPPMNRITAHALTMLAGLLEKLPSARIKLFVQGCGGVIALDTIEPMLHDAGILDRIDYLEPAEDRWRGFSEFLDHADLILDLEGDCGADCALNALCRLTPVLTILGNRPWEREVADLLTGIGLVEDVVAGIDSAAARAAALLGDASRFETHISTIRERMADASTSEAGDARVKKLQESLFSMVESRGREG